MALLKKLKSKILPPEDAGWESQPVHYTDEDREKLKPALEELLNSHDLEQTKKTKIMKTVLVDIMGGKEETNIESKREAK